MRNITGYRRKATDAPVAVYGIKLGLMWSISFGKKRKFVARGGKGEIESRDLADGVSHAVYTRARNFCDFPFWPESRPRTRGTVRGHR